MASGNDNSKKLAIYFLITFGTSITNLYQLFIEPDCVDPTLFKHAIKFALLEGNARLVKVWHGMNGLLIPGIDYQEV